MPDPLPDLSKYDAVLIDLDGTFYREEPAGERVLPGAVELVTRLAAQGKPYACLTNSGASPRQLTHRLAHMGVKIGESHIWSCAAAAAEYVLTKYGEGCRVFNMSTDGMDELLSARVQWVNSEKEPCDVVIVAGPVNRRSNPENHWKALQLLRAGAGLVGLCADRVYPSHRGLEFGSGSMTAMLAFAVNTTPVFCGKPEAFFFRQLCSRLHVAPERCILLGDNLDSDVAGAHAVNMTAALVLTGVANRADVAKLPKEKHPHYIIEDLTKL